MDSLRVPLIFAEIVALGFTLGVVENTTIRLVLGLTIGLLLARSTLVGQSSDSNRPPSGLPERREDHLFRHWLNTLIRKAREFHAVCQAVKEERVNVAVGQLKIQQIETELTKLLHQIADAAKPQQVKRLPHRHKPLSGTEPRSTKRSPESQYDTDVEEYGDLAKD